MSGLGEIRVGTILVASGGYEQTNVHAYQVVGMTKSGKSARIRRIEVEQVPGSDTGHMSDRCRPVPGAFTSDEVLTKRVQASASSGQFLHLDYPGDLWVAVGWGPCPGCDGELAQLDNPALPSPHLGCSGCGGMFEGRRRESWYRSWYA